MMRMMYSGFMLILLIFSISTAGAEMTYFVQTTDEPSSYSNMDTENEEMRVCYEAHNRMDEYVAIAEEVNMNASLCPLIARCIYQQEENQYTTVFTLDKGIDDGVEPGMPVVYLGVLVGIVYESQESSSTVRTILHPGFMTEGSVRESIDKPGIVLSLHAKNSKSLLQMFLAEESLVHINDIVYTSGGTIVRGILIGSVQEIILNKDGLPDSAIIHPFAVFSWLPYAIVLRNAPNSGT